MVDLTLAHPERLRTTQKQAEMTDTLVAAQSLPKVQASIDLVKGTN